MEAIKIAIDGHKDSPAHGKVGGLYTRKYPLRRLKFDKKGTQVEVVGDKASADAKAKNQKWKLQEFGYKTSKFEIWNEEHPDFRLAATADGKVFADNGGFADSQIWKFDAFAENGYYLHN